jgi:serine/threonine-protein kinase
VIASEPTPICPDDGDRVGTVLHGTYRIDRLIATGGMGSVYEVVHLRLQQRFALKVLEHRAAGNDQAYARFRQEVEIAVSLNHASIVQVFDYNTDHVGNPYMVMELVDGITLGEFLDGVPQRPRDLLRVFEPLCSALEAAHRVGVVHRDLKPSNVMVRRLPSGKLEIKLLDFGISKIRDAGAQMTCDNVVMGTPNYMSPEQAAGHASSVNATTDIFALGTILYEMLSGTQAFSADSVHELLRRLVHEEPTPLSELRPQLSAELVDVVHRCLHKDPDQRFGSARELQLALRKAIRPAARVTPIPKLLPPLPFPRSAPQPISRGWSWALTWLSGAAAGGATTWFILS